MANWSSNRITVTGEVAQLNAVASRINSAVERQDDYNYALNLKHGGTETDWLMMREPVKVQDGKISFWGECPHYPPIEGLLVISREFPAILIEVTYDVEGIWDAGAWRIENGNAEMVKHRRGYFVSAEDDQPIHHWLLRRVGDEATQAIKDAGLATRGEENHILKELTVRDMKAAGELLTEQFPDAKVAADAYTLDEEGYMCSLQTIHDEGGPDCRRLDRLLTVAERDVALTQHEVSLLRDNLVQCLKSKSHETVIGRYRRYYGNIALGLEVEFHPTGQEIVLLLPHITDELRKKELEQAFANPRWTKSWPEWEIREEERQREEQKRSQQHAQGVQADADFLEELKNL